MAQWLPRSALLALLALLAIAAIAGTVLVVPLGFSW